jgi:hypothetical protein
MPRDALECSTHGRSIATFVCKHVGGDQRAGFIFDQDSLDPWPDAVCSACAAEPPWTDEVAAERIRLICARCWEAAFERHLVDASNDDADWLHAAVHRVQARQDRWTARHGINDQARFDYCFDEGQARLAFGDGGAGAFRVRCDAHVIGSWGRNSGTWLWGWANDHWEPRATEMIVRVKRRGEREGILSLVRSGFAADEDLAWSLAASALDSIPELEGIYRCPGDNGSLFIGVSGTRAVS